jgi:hypothetical protein
VTGHAVPTSILASCALVASSVTSACVSTNGYTTPRALPAGGFSVTVAGETVTALRSSRNARGPFTEREERSTGYIVVPPTLITRVGLGRRTEGGLRLLGMGYAAVDVKVELSRRPLSLALDPAGAVGPNTGYLEVPLLAGVEASERVMIVAAAGPAVANGSYPNSREERDFGMPWPAGVLAKGGLGVDVLIGRGMAVHPEITVLRSVAAVEGAYTSYSMGIGFTGANLQRGRDENDWVPRAY